MQFCFGPRVDMNTLGMSIVGSRIMPFVVDTSGRIFPGDIPEISQYKRFKRVHSPNQKQVVDT